MKIYLASFILFLAVLLPSCHEQNVTDTSKQDSLDEDTQDLKSNWKLSFDIINTVLPELISTQSYTKNPKNTLFVYPKHISIDSVLAQELIARGVKNDQVYSIEETPSYPTYNYPSKMEHGKLTQRFA